MKSVNAAGLAGEQVGEWISGRLAIRLSGRNAYSILKMALLGRVRYKAEVGESLRFHREDVLRLGNGG